MIVLQERVLQQPLFVPQNPVFEVILMTYCSKFLCGTALCALAAISANAAVDPNPMLGMRVSTGTTPAIDGKISGGEWDDAAKLPPFIMVESSMARYRFLKVPPLLIAALVMPVLAVIFQLFFNGGVR